MTNYKRYEEIICDICKQDTPVIEGNSYTERIFLCLGCADTKYMFLLDILDNNDPPLEERTKTAITEEAAQLFDLIEEIAYDQEL